MLVKVVLIVNYVVGGVYNWPPTWRNDFFEGNPPLGYMQLEQFQVDMGVDMNWLYEGGDFYPPPDTSPRFGRIITKLAYRMRFTPSERVAIKMAALGLNPLITPEQQAAVAVSEDDIMASHYIHLDRPDTIAGTTFLETIGLIGTGRAEEILGPPVYSVELMSETRELFGMPKIPTEKEWEYNAGKGYATLQEYQEDNPPPQ